MNIIELDKLKEEMIKYASDCRRQRSLGEDFKRSKMERSDKDPETEEMMKRYGCLF